MTVLLNDYVLCVLHTISNVLLVRLSDFSSWALLNFKSCLHYYINFVRGYSICVSYDNLQSHTSNCYVSSAWIQDHPGDHYLVFEN